MKWYCVLSAFLLAMFGVASTAMAQVGDPYDEISPVDGEFVLNTRHCFKADGLESTRKCPDISNEEARACPVGSCFSWGVGCQNLEGTGKQSQREKLNDGSIKQPVDDPKHGKKVKIANPATDIIDCFKSRECICRSIDGIRECVPGPWKIYAIAKYTITEEECPPPVFIDPAY
jgi:hypothetical protein